MPLGQLARSFARGAALNCLIAAVPPMLYLVFATDVTWTDVWLNWCFSYVYSGTIWALTSTWFHMVGPRLGHFPPVQRVLLVFGSLTAMALVGSSFATGVLYGLGLISSRILFSQWVGSIKVSLLITWAIGSTIYVYRVTHAKLEQTTLALRTKELERERAEKAATSARLSSLESRIHPHFLFNALNSVAALIRDDPDRAEQQVERIARFLRFAIDQAGAGPVTVAQELRIAEDYLAIEKTRFGDRLRYEVTLQPEAASFAVPPLSIQTLIENSVKYAVAPRREGGVIRVSAAVENGKLAIRVWDDGPGFAASSRRAGHGLDLLATRLDAQFGAASRLHFRNGTGMTVEMELPCAPI